MSKMNKTSKSYNDENTRVIQMKKGESNTENEKIYSKNLNFIKF